VQEYRGINRGACEGVPDLRNRTEPTAGSARRHSATIAFARKREKTQRTNPKKPCGIRLKHSFRTILKKQEKYRKNQKVRKNKSDIRNPTERTSKKTKKGTKAEKTPYLTGTEPFFIPPTIQNLSFV